MLLIDGYNLLHATPIFGEGALAGTLQGSREALLRFLADRLPAGQRVRTTIVFDAAEAPPGLPATSSFEGIAVHYARDYPDADAMIEALLDKRQHRKGLLVVSSDRRVQRAARQSGAKWTDAEPWYRELARQPAVSPEQGKQSPAGNIGDAGYWTETFSDPETIQAIEEEMARLIAKPVTPSPPSKSSQKNSRTKKLQRPQVFGEGIFEGFPPGYADDLAKELDGKPNAADPNADNRDAR